MKYPGIVDVKISLRRKCLPAFLLAQTSHLLSQDISFFCLWRARDKTEGFYPDSKVFQMALKTGIWTEIAKSIFRCDDKDHFDDLHILICEKKECCTWQTKNLNL